MLELLKEAAGVTSAAALATPHHRSGAPRNVDRVHEYQGNVKKCSSCGKTKPVGEFYWLVARKAGLRVAYRRCNCVECHRRVTKRNQVRRAVHVRAKRAAPQGFVSEARRPEPEAVDACVCGGLRAWHANGGKGGMVATGCPGFFAKGE